MGDAFMQKFMITSDGYIIVSYTNAVPLVLDREDDNEWTPANLRRAIDVIASAIEEALASAGRGARVIRVYGESLEYSTAEGLDRLLDEVLIDGCASLRAEIIG